jgi:hypothetical protein
MLKQPVENADTRSAANIPEKKLWQDESRNTPSLGCWGCPERAPCGMLAVEAGLTSCLDLCCGKPAKCDKPCRNNPDYALRVREVGTFFLDNVPRGPVLHSPPLPFVIPVIFHGNRRERPIGPSPVVLPLYKMFSRREGVMRFTTHEELCAEFCITPGTPVILTGTDEDAPIERWWGYESRRREIICALRKIGVVFSTTPNFSLFVDVPRHVDLHAIKRIGLVHAEFLAEGLPCALHVNGRSETDFKRWADYICARPEITHIAYEFTTGSARTERRPIHVEALVGIAAAARRPLHLIMRGGIEVLPQLSAAFSRVSVLETWSFMKTMKRQRAMPRGNGSLRWRRSPTRRGEPVDDLYAINRAAVGRWIGSYDPASSMAATG